MREAGTQLIADVLQQWRGHITSVGSKYFWAMLEPVSGDETDEVEMEFIISKVPERDRHFICPGRFLYFTIGEQSGYEWKFEDFGQFTPAELDAAEKEASELRKRLFETV